MKASIVIPTHDHGLLLPFAVRSVLAQTMQDFEILIIGDGITDDARASLDATLALDPRIRFFDYPKSLSKGATHRHEALLHHSTGDFVCYITDDDLWFPDHLQRMAEKLVRHDIVHSETIYVRPDGTFEITPVDWGTSAWREWSLIKHQNVVSISSVGHTQSFYRKLPLGWHAWNDGYATDHHMWMQMLAVREASAASNHLISVASFHSGWRRHMSEEELANELRQWEMRMMQNHEEIRESALRHISTVWMNREKEILDLRRQIQDLRATRDAMKQRLSDAKNDLHEAKNSLAKERLKIKNLPGPLRALCRHWDRFKGSQNA